MQEVIVFIALLFSIGYLLKKFYDGFIAKKQKCSNCSFNNALNQSEKK